MKRDMALNFKKRWIPFVLEFAQANLRKANEAQLSRYRRGMIFLASAFAEKFDEDGFEYSWRSGEVEEIKSFLERLGIPITEVVLMRPWYEMEIDLGKIQSAFKWISKYMGRKDKKDAHMSLLYFTRTICRLNIKRGLSGTDHFALDYILHKEDTAVERILRELKSLGFWDQPVPVIDERIHKMRQEVLRLEKESVKDKSLEMSRKVAFFFARLLDELPLSSIRKCKGCDHYFLHLSKREKIYCTSACAGQSIQRKKREDLRENHPWKYKAFLKKQKEIMRHRRSLTKETL